MIDIDGIKSKDYIGGANNTVGLTPAAESFQTSDMNSLFSECKYM